MTGIPKRRNTSGHGHVAADSHKRRLPPDALAGKCRAAKWQRKTFASSAAKAAPLRALHTSGLDPHPAAAFLLPCWQRALALRTFGGIFPPAFADEGTHYLNSANRVALCTCGFTYIIHSTTIAKRPVAHRGRIFYAIKGSRLAISLAFAGFGAFCG